MKKFLIALLALAMMFALAVPVFAEPSEVSVPGSSSADVTAKYEAGNDGKDDIATVYLVTVDWKVDSTLKYSNGTTTYTWNADATKYDKTTEEDGWFGSATVGITVTNKSNAAVSAKAEWANEAGITAACTFTGNEIEVASAAAGIDLSSDDLQGAPVSATITANVAAPTAGSISSDDAKVGAVTLTISKVNG